MIKSAVSITLIQGRGKTVRNAADRKLGHYEPLAFAFGRLTATLAVLFGMPLGTLAGGLSAHRWSHGHEARSR